MIVDGIDLLQMVKENMFKDGDMIIAEISINSVYVYYAYIGNFVNKQTKKELTVRDCINWTFKI